MNFLKLDLRKARLTIISNTAPQPIGAQPFGAPTAVTLIFAEDEQVVEVTISGEQKGKIK